MPSKRTKNSERLEFEDTGVEPPQAPRPAEGDDLVPLESILCTEELDRRPNRAPDYETENRAFVALAQALADSPRTILQTLAEKVLEVLRVDSAGLSLLTKDEKSFHWAAIAGAWQPHVGGGTPRNFGPCGDVLDRNAPMLFTHWERRYPYLVPATPLAEEGLLVPFHVGGRAVGTIWAIAHDHRRKFDAEDLRQLESLGRFASAAYQAVESLAAFEQSRAALSLMEDAVYSRELADRLNRELRNEIAERERAEQALRESESRYRGIFENARVAVWEEDFSAVADLLDEIRAEGIGDLREYFRARPGRFAEALHRVRIVDVNDFAVELFEAQDKNALLGSLASIFLPETETVFLEELVALWEGRRRFESATPVRTLKGRRLDVVFTITFEGDRYQRTLVSILDISERRAAERRLEALNRIGNTISGDLDLERIVQTVTESATELSGAKFGAFFYNVTNEHGESYLLYTLSGASREAFEKFGLPRNTAVFEPTFRGAGVVRSDDIRKDPRYGRNAPHYGMPKGHLPVVSYLAVPVVSRTGVVHGGLFFAHDRPGVFTQEAEEIVTGIAAHAAVAIDNARLYQAEKRLATIVESTDDAVMTKDLNGVITSWNRGATRLFGYASEEAVGKPATVLIAPDRQDEESRILGRISRGERVESYETVSVRKDGSRVDVSVSVSAVIDAGGKVVAASAIARDITDRRRAEELQTLLHREMSHRVKNVFAVTSGMVALSARSARTPRDMAKAVQGRLSALTRAHELTRPGLIDSGAQAIQATTLHAVLQEIIAPYLDPEGSGDRAVINGPDVPVAGNAVTSLALILHEFTTNAAKYGALSSPAGCVRIDCAVGAGELLLIWKERGGPYLDGRPDEEGFGAVLTRRIAVDQFGGGLSHDWQAEGLVIRLSVPLYRLTT